MKKSLLTVLILAISLSSWTQNLQKPSQSEIRILPDWAQMMYSDDPSIFEVDNLFREY